MIQGIKIMQPFGMPREPVFNAKPVIQPLRNTGIKPAKQADSGCGKKLDFFA